MGTDRTALVWNFRCCQSTDLRRAVLSLSSENTAKLHRSAFEWTCLALVVFQVTGRQLYRRLARTGKLLRVGRAGRIVTLLAPWSSLKP